MYISCPGLECGKTDYGPRCCRDYEECITENGFKLLLQFGVVVYTLKKMNCHFALCMKIAKLRKIVIGHGYFIKNFARGFVSIQIIHMMT